MTSESVVKHASSIFYKRKSNGATELCDVRASSIAYEGGPG